MAKVKIQGHASGTGVLTVTAPNTSTDRTITLPDADVTLGAATPSIDDNGDATAITITSDEKVGIGETAPLGFLHVKNGDSGQGSINAAGNSLVLESNGGAGITFLTGSSSNGSIIWGDSESNYQGVVLYDHSASAMKFITSGSERVRVTDNGLTFNGDTSSANALDDYEEGAWTPAFTASGGSAGSVAHSVQEGYYTKIGRLVTCQFNLTLTNRGSWSSEVRLTGLPFDPADTFPAAGSVSLDNVNVPNDASGHDVYVNPGVTYFRFYYTQDFASRTFVQVSQVTDSADFNGIISYIV